MCTYSIIHRLRVADHVLTKLYLLKTAFTTYIILMYVTDASVNIAVSIHDHDKWYITTNIKLVPSTWNVDVNAVSSVPRDTIVNW